MSRTLSSPSSRPSRAIAHGAGTYNHGHCWLAKPSTSIFRQSPPRRMGPGSALDSLACPGRRGERMCVRVLAACLPELLQIRCPSPKRGRRECRVPLHPRSRVPRTRIWRTRAYRSAETARHSPRNGFTAYFVLSPVSEFVLSPSTAGYFPPAWHQQRVSGPHDLAVRLGVSSGAKNRLTPSVHHIPGPTHRDDRETPLVWAGMRELIMLISRSEKRNIFDLGLDTISENQK